MYWFKTCASDRSPNKINWEELLGMSIPELEVNGSSDEIAANIARIMQSGGARFERQHRRKDGCIIDVELSVNHLAKFGGRIICFLRDVSERKRAQTLMRTSEERFSAFMSHLPAAAFIKDSRWSNLLRQ